MATLATLIDRFWLVRDKAASDTAALPAREDENSYMLRPLPNEDVYLFVKRIDNTRVVRQADPKAGGTCWKMIGVTSVMAALLIGLLLPSAYSALAGYQIQALKEEHERLVNEKAALEVEEARLLSPERLQELAKMQQFIDPAPGSVVYLDSKSGASVAMRAGNR